jgi:hypothetical protein
LGNYEDTKDHDRGRDGGGVFCGRDDGFGCDGPKAEKKFDSSLPDAQLVDIVMNGKKPEKPPNMPAYGAKGITADQAKALVEQMKQLKSAP